jgi:hypothetical protein
LVLVVVLEFYLEYSLRDGDYERGALSRGALLTHQLQPALRLVIVIAEHAAEGARVVRPDGFDRRVELRRVEEVEDLSAELEFCPSGR